MTRMALVVQLTILAIPLVDGSSCSSVAHGVCQHGDELSFLQVSMKTAHAAARPNASKTAMQVLDSLGSTQVAGGLLAPAPRSDQRQRGQAAGFQHWQQRQARCLTYVNHCGRIPDLAWTSLAVAKGLQRNEVTCSMFWYVSGQRNAKECSGKGPPCGHNYLPFVGRCPRGTRLPSDFALPGEESESSLQTDRRNAHARLTKETNEMKQEIDQMEAKLEQMKALEAERQRARNN